MRWTRFEQREKKGKATKNKNKISILLPTTFKAFVSGITVGFYFVVVGNSGKKELASGIKFFYWENGKHNNNNNKGWGGGGTRWNSLSIDHCLFFCVILQCFLWLFVEFSVLRCNFNRKSLWVLISPFVKRTNSIWRICVLPSAFIGCI